MCLTPQVIVIYQTDYIIQTEVIVIDQTDYIIQTEVTCDCEVTN